MEERFKHHPGADPGDGGIKDDGLAYPPALLRQLESNFPEQLRALEESFRKVKGSAEAGAPALHDAFLIDGYQLAIADLLLADRSPRGLFVYLPGQDILLGSLLSGAESAPSVRSEEAARLGSALRMEPAQEILLEELDRGLARLMSRLGPSDLVALVIDPGRFFRGERGESARGRLILFGGIVVAPGSRGEISELDVTPTLLRLAGLPLSSELAGRSAPGLESIVSWPMGSGTVATYGDRPEAISGTEGSEEVLRRLRSLGYIE
jgi:hypothetical protein